MGLFELHVDRIDVTTVPKFVLFGCRDRDEPTSEATVSVDGDRSRLPVSPAKVVAVSIAATVLAFAAARLKARLENR